MCKSPLICKGCRNVSELVRRGGGAAYRTRTCDPRITKALEITGDYVNLSTCCMVIRTLRLAAPTPLPNSAEFGLGAFPGKRILAG